MGIFIHAKTKMIFFSILFSLGLGTSVYFEMDFYVQLLMVGLFGIAFLILYREKKQDDYWDNRRKECKNHNQRIHLHSMFLIAPYYCSECCERQSFYDDELIEVKDGRNTYYVLSEKGLQNNENVEVKS